MPRNSLTLGFVAVGIFFVAGASATAEPTSATSQEIKPGDTVIVAQDGVKLMLGDKVVAEVRKGAEIKVTTIKGEWIGGQIEIVGKKETGWLKRSQVMLPSPGAGGTASRSGTDKSPSGGLPFRIVELKYERDKEGKYEFSLVIEKLAGKWEDVGDATFLFRPDETPNLLSKGFRTSPGDCAILGNLA